MSDENGCDLCNLGEVYPEADEVTLCRKHYDEFDNRRSPEASTLKVGDRVTTSDVGTVVAVDGKEVMVRWDGDGEPDDWVRREELRRADRTDYPMPAWAEDAEGDAKLPEDAAIKAAFPTRSGRHDLYGEAMRLVGARRSKAGLVSLVTWLLLRAGGGAK